MLSNNLDFIEILSCKINSVYYDDLLNAVDNAIIRNKNIIITGANAHIINLAQVDKEFRNCLKGFDIVHPDGIGLYLAMRFLYPKSKKIKRITGSDFYKELIPHSIKRNYSFYFLGDTNNTLNRIPLNIPDLKINGMNNGFGFNTDLVIDSINKSNSDILIVGLGSGFQEKWIAENKSKVNTKVIIAVGDGIKVFAGTKKRGPKLIQKIGLEWFVRFLYEPKRLWKRYFIGIPLFIFRVIKFKFSNYKNTE